MLLIGICGASGSGKSTLARELQNRLKGRCVYLKQDSYYVDHADMSFEELERVNYDEPAAYDHDLIYRDMISLKRGEAITEKDYDFNRHRRADTGAMIESADVVIFEGIHAFYDERLRALMDLKIYIQVDPDVCLLRRVRRDIRDRGRTVERIYRQYLETVKPMFEKYIRNYVNYADLIVAQGGKSARIADMLAHYINSGMEAVKE